MKDFFKKHKWQLTILILLIIVAGVSGYYNFHAPITNTQTLIEQNTNGTEVKDDSNITSYKLQVTSTASAKDSTSSTFIINITNTTITPPITVTNTPVIPHPEPEFQNPITFTLGNEEYLLEYRENQSVYEFMQALSADSKKPFIFETKNFPGLGYFVESINGIKNDKQTGKYWIYYINNEPASTGILNYIIQPGDKIEWKYESTNF
ncbi:MAG TPA: hypothetical protein DEB09_01085 [Candidatus Magasanikbacteria bacterium]|nr:hypothetical protein [Candidatus Magasanikbacteria bacterium]